MSALSDGVKTVSDAESEGGVAPRVPERYFIVKSLTLQDLDASVRNGIWATQSQNEEALNQAFEVSIKQNAWPALPMTLTHDLVC